MHSDPTLGTSEPTCSPCSMSTSAIGKLHRVDNDDPLQSYSMNEHPPECQYLIGTACSQRLDHGGLTTERGAFLETGVGQRGSFKDKKHAIAVGA